LAAQQHAAAGFAAENARVIPNGFDLEVFRPSPGRRATIRARLGIGEDIVVVLHVARFNPVKGHREFIMALGTILPENPRILGVMVGKDVDERNSDLMVQIRRSNADGQIMLLGERSDVEAIMAAGDIFVLSSRAEAFPNALGKAMAAGLLCITTTAGDSAEIVGDAGFVIERESVPALVQALRAALALPAAERANMAAAARARIDRHFSMSAVVRQYEEVWEEAIRVGCRHARDS
jgi:glycosyltransferase involved in cell wall biosynthesis